MADHKVIDGKVYVGETGAPAWAGDPDEVAQMLQRIEELEAVIEAKNGVIVHVAERAEAVARAFRAQATNYRDQRRRCEELEAEKQRLKRASQFDRRGAQEARNFYQEMKRQRDKERRRANIYVGHIEDLSAALERLEAERDEARRWARAWKAKAKEKHTWLHWNAELNAKFLRENVCWKMRAEHARRAYHEQKRRRRELAEAVRQLEAPPVAPSRCIHKDVHLVCGSRWSGDSDHGRYDVTLCYGCGRFHVHGLSNDEPFDLTFTLVASEQLKAAGKSVVYYHADGDPAGEGDDG